MKKQKVIQALRQEKYLTVIPSGSKITIVREFGRASRKVLSFDLIAKKEGYFLDHPSYVFRSTVSHFKATKDDVRLSLSKTYLSSLIKMLKRTGVWPLIINKKFLVVNDKNKKSHKDRVQKELRNLLS